MAGNDNLIADAVLALAVAAGTGDGARNLQFFKALLVHGRNHGSGPADSCFQAIGYLVYRRQSAFFRYLSF